MDKIHKAQNFDNATPIRREEPPAPYATPHFYPAVHHQHPSFGPLYNKTNLHQQSPLLLNVPKQQPVQMQQFSNQYATGQQQQQQYQQQQQLTPNSTVGGASEGQVKLGAASTPKLKKEGEKKQLRSPSAKRPPNAPVTMQGWLHKQGSEGLMLWKKRWFVLSEYCLFYYKGLQQEKLLGSILLPSYKVSVCGPEDKVNRKFAFKCEHANMRTYILAADSHDLMMQWVHVLNLACNLQNTLEPSAIDHHQDNSRSTTSNVTSGQTTYSDQSQPEYNISQYHQPLYANAPPKPRRVTEGYYSPDIVDRYHYNDPRKSQPPQPLYNDHRLLITPQNVVDRRTPDTYARSNMAKFRNVSDYEDIYNEQVAYKRPLSPIAPDNLIKKDYPSVTVSYPPIKSYAPPPVELMRPNYPNQIPMRSPQAQVIPRPHSADFLEYRPNKIELDPSAAPVLQQSRPKSSLDINMYSRDCDQPPRSRRQIDGQGGETDYFYSQERYAEKMRKSAQYLQKHPPVKFQRHDMAPNHQPVRSRSALSESSLLCAQDIENDSISREYQLEREQPPNVLFNAKNLVAQDQFNRSASARLTQNASFEDDLRKTEGERKREESMKRLLEWKQRMLQSPLNRKAQSQVFRDYPSTGYSTAGADKKLKKTGMTNRRSVHNLSQYNSYSSDDEENGEKSSKHTQAGRTVDTFPNNSDSHTHASFTSTTALRPPDESTTSFHTQSEEARSDASVAQIADADSNGDVDDGALKKEPPPVLPEGNYTPMSPKINSVFQLSRDCDDANGAIANDSEENHYVEMSRAVVDGTAFMEPSDQQQYETVCFRKDKIEPVYMELPEEAAQKLPDIVQHGSQDNNDNKSLDSSDADDEASKDFESLENSTQPRFSLSDTFRPASYYLGVSKTLPEFQDSSDSELVSPPPIPASSPPLDDDDYIPTAMRTKKDKLPLPKDTSSSMTCLDRTDSGGSAASLNRRRPISDDFSTPTEYGRIEDIQGIDKYFAMLKQSEEEMSGQVGAIEAEGEMDDEDEELVNAHAYENFLKAHRTGPTSVALDKDNSNRSTPSAKGNNTVVHPHVVVPYYYSDLSGNISNLETLNNQRGSVNNGSKRDITHIVNPIKCTLRDVVGLQECNTTSLAAAARSASADFLNLTDKSDNIDKKNIYESDTLKRYKAENFHLHKKSDKFDTESNQLRRKSFSLEGLLENVLNSNIGESTAHRDENIDNAASEGSFYWEEDSVWREQLRSVSQRHTKSMDDLGAIDNEPEIIKKKPSRAITRDVTYVNDILFKGNETAKSSEIKKKGSFLIDRETLRQWDLMSSAPSDHQTLKVVDDQGNQVHVVVDSVEGSIENGDNRNIPEAASGSISINTRDSALGRDTFPKIVTERSAAVPFQNIQARSYNNLERLTTYGPDKNLPNYASWNTQQQHHHHHHHHQQQQQQQQHQQDYLFYEREHQENQKDIAPKTKINVSAGELLGRTHEELVLLLIQLRRQQAQTFQAIESCYNEIDTLQMRMHNLDQARRLENFQKLERIKQNLLELERQYEKRKPLVNLVDNMVKLGSLYRTTPNDRTRHIRERLEFSQYIEERRLLAEEKRDWNRIEPSHLQLQEKVRQLYHLDNLIQEESRNLHNLQRDKEDIERALGGLRNRLLKGLNNPEEIEQARRQQFLLENELSRVHLMLAQNSKKLEETVAGNARLEQELLVLKQKFQTSKQQRSSPQFSSAGDSLPYLAGSSQALENDLEKVKKKIGDLHKQREELSLQVKQLTDRSTTPHSHNSSSKMTSPIDNYAASNVNKKKPTSFWRETDLDTMNSIDHGYGSYSSISTTPLYINTDIKSSDYADRNLKTSDSTNSEDTALFPNQLEKQEIKTVRIVKRESERRQRDREKTFSGKCDALAEEDDSSQASSVLFRPTSLPQKLTYDHLPLPTGFNTGLTNNNPVAELSPVFKSEAAKQIITEVSKKTVPTSQGQRRAVPKQHRRHYTAPHNNFTALGETLEGRRARDDLDIERALRQRIDAPDLVRSTLSNKELKYSEETIDNILSTPNKILIPERYIPEQIPQLSVEEQEKRKRKVESIKKMLSDTAILSASTAIAHNDDKSAENKTNPGGSILEEKKQRQHLLQLNQILAKQVMEISKVVAVKNLELMKSAPPPPSTEEEDSSPVTPLPLYQQRENFYS